MKNVNPSVSKKKAFFFNISCLFNRRKLDAKLQEAMETIDQLNTRCSGLEKTKSRLQGELEDMTIEVEKVNGHTKLI